MRPLNWNCRYVSCRWVTSRYIHAHFCLTPTPPQDSIDALNRTQTRGLEGQLYNKVNELQEDLSMKKFDLRAKQIHLAAIRAQVSCVRGEKRYLAGTQTKLTIKFAWGEELKAQATC